MAKARRSYPRYGEDTPLSDELTAAIGALVVAWGHLEDSATILTAVLLETNNPFDFRAVSSNMATRGKFDTLSAVASLKLPTAKARTIKSIAAQATNWTGERNRIVHGSWYPTRKPNIAQRYAYTARGELRQTDEEISAARIRGFTADVARLRRRLNHALSRAGFYKPRPPAST
jgi:hypothetical protein